MSENGNVLYSHRYAEENVAHPYGSAEANESEQCVANLGGQIERMLRETALDHVEIARVVVRGPGRTTQEH